MERRTVGSEEWSSREAVERRSGGALERKSGGAVEQLSEGGGLFPSLTSLDTRSYGGITSCLVCRSHRSRSSRMELTYVVRVHECACACARSCARSCVRVCPRVSVCVRVCPCVPVCVRMCSCLSACFRM